MQDATLPEKMELWPIEDLKPFAKNSRTHSTEQVNQIAASMTEFGWTNPVLANSDGMIIAGHGRVEAAKKLGLTEVPVITLDHLTEEQVRAYVIADNKLAENAGWDDAILKEELEALNSLDFDLDVIGFSDEELENLDIDLGFGDSDGPSGENDQENSYTDKVEIPIYEPKGERPEVDQLFSEEKTKEILEKINSKNLPDDIRFFLIKAAYRHTVFDYENIAEYYAHADKETQELFEDSALVIIDFEKAIESGFVKMSRDLAEAYDEQRNKSK